MDVCSYVVVIDVDAVDSVAAGAVNFDSSVVKIFDDCKFVVDIVNDVDSLEGIRFDISIALDASEVFHDNTNGVCDESIVIGIVDHIDCVGVIETVAESFVTVLSVKVIDIVDSVVGVE